MDVYLGRGKRARRAYGFDEVALVPGRITFDPDDVDTSFELAGEKYALPILAAAMDGVVDVRIAVEMSKLGGIAVLNLEGVQTRYEHPAEVISKIVEASPEQAALTTREIYSKPIKDELVSKRIREIKEQGGVAAVSATPAAAKRLGPLASDAGADIFVLQSTVTTATHSSTKENVLSLADFCEEMSIPVIIGNCVSYEVTKDLMQAGASAVLVGIGPGAACTTRAVVGVGVPQITAVADCAAARDVYYRQTGRYVPIICDGGMRVGGDICKAIAAGADAVMIGSPIAKAKEAPGQGFHWGMATPHPGLPRGTRVHVGTHASLKEILVGPAQVDDGTQNLVGALRTSMGVCGARNLREMQQVEIVIAPAITSEGKFEQKHQHVGMGK